MNGGRGHETGRPLFVAHLGWIHRARGDYGRALGVGREAVELAEDVGHPWWIAFAGAMLGWTLTDLYRFKEAAIHLRRGLEAAELDGAESYLVRCLAQLAWVDWSLGETDRALQTG